MFTPKSAAGQICRKRCTSGRYWWRITLQCAIDMRSGAFLRSSRACGAFIRFTGGVCDSTTEPLPFHLSWRHGRPGWPLGGGRELGICLWSLQGGQPPVCGCVEGGRPEVVGGRECRAATPCPADLTIRIQQFMQRQLPPLPLAGCVPAWRRRGDGGGAPLCRGGSPGLRHPGRCVGRRRLEFSAGCAGVYKVWVVRPNACSVHPVLRTARPAAVREAVEAGQELGTLPLHRQRPGAPSAPGAAVACLIRGTSLQQLAQQLQDCSTPAIQCEYISPPPSFPAALLGARTKLPCCIAAG